MGGWLLVYQLNNQVFPQTVVWYNFSVNFFLAGKTKSGKTRIAPGFTSLQEREAEYGFSGFITTNKK